ncbi:MAG: hypothetical protein AXW14_08865 [Alteromonas sp. Nap_26]|nr:MAG: hypothetical protein AXW14_08865 [Alteromonas sp. Nap_26]
MLSNQNFTDPQGQSFTAAVIRVKSAAYNRNWYGNENESLNLDVMQPSAALLNEKSTDSNENSNVQVEFAYWPDQEAFDAGRHPYTLTRTENERFTTLFTIGKDVLEKPEYADLPLEELCEQFLTNEILPNLV